MIGQGHDPEPCGFARQGSSGSTPPRATAPGLFRRTQACSPAVGDIELSTDAGVPLDATFPTLAEYLANLRIRHGWLCGQHLQLQRLVRPESWVFSIMKISTKTLRPSTRSSFSSVAARPRRPHVQARQVAIMLKTTQKYRCYRKIEAATINRDGALTWLLRTGEIVLSSCSSNYYDVYDPYEPPVRGLPALPAPPPRKGVNSRARWPSAETFTTIAWCISTTRLPPTARRTQAARRSRQHNGDHHRRPRRSVRASTVSPGMG